MRLISFLSLLLLVGCFGRTVPTVRDTKQYVLRFKTIQTGGMTIIDPLSVECYERSYRFTEQYVGGLNDAKRVEVENCNNLVGWTNDYGLVAGFWESLRVYLSKQKSGMEKRTK